MKTPIGYYGGKQNMVNYILPLIPPHVQYVEPFIGGGAIFFKKPVSHHEVINDFDGRLINFYRTVVSDFEALQEKIQYTIHSEALHQESKKMLKEPVGLSNLDLAWAYWVQTQMSFSKKLFGGFAFDNEGKTVRAVANMKANFTTTLFKRLKHIEIFNRDAVDLIKTKDSPETFFYLDPPYAESDCGQYDHLKDVYYRLLDHLPEIKGKFLMSSYPSEQLDKVRKANGYNSKDIEQNVFVASEQNSGKKKTECLTWNYELPQLKLF